MSNPEISKKALWLPGFRNLFGPRLGITEFGISLAAGTVPLVATDVLRKLRSPDRGSDDPPRNQVPPKIV